MGYTRYWKRTGKAITQEFLDEVSEILADCKRRGIIIRGWDGKGEPEVTLDRVALNGNRETDLDHETFSIDNGQGDGFYIGDFRFCKTARKPYDYAVRKILRTARDMGLVRDVSSDGRNEKIVSDAEWLEGR